VTGGLTRRVVLSWVALAGCHGSSGFRSEDAGGSHAPRDATTDAPRTHDSGNVLVDTGCLGTESTTITGKVYDPAGLNPLYHVEVYVPKAPLTPLPKGVPTGPLACSCGALFPSGAITSTTTSVDGSFTLRGVPAGPDVPLVLQIGKWRRLVKLNVDACVDNPQPDGSLSLPATVLEGDTENSIPEIAVSTGLADTLECLMIRVGLAPTEFVAGYGTTGHVHVFSGGLVRSAADGDAGLNGVGQPEPSPMPDAPASSESLWRTSNQLMGFDLVLLSCEGGETYNANPQAMETYLNAGGRVFASHYHYAWFSGPLGSGQTYMPPMDWGTNLATWGDDTVSNTTEPEIGGTLVTTLNGTGKPFAKGQVLASWLANVGALSQNSVGPGELSIFDPRFNATVGPANAPSQPWILADTMSDHPGKAMYFSFDTPVNAPPAADGGAQYCGRAVFSDLHVAGDPSERDNSPPPNGCDPTGLSPQEKALEFMLFDLSACVVADQVPGIDAGFPK
jgi:hypothetical protein